MPTLLCRNLVKLISSSPSTSTRNEHSSYPETKPPSSWALPQHLDSIQVYVRMTRAVVDSYITLCFFFWLPAGNNNRPCPAANSIAGCVGAYDLVLHLWESSKPCGTSYVLHNFGGLPDCTVSTSSCVGWAVLVEQMHSSLLPSKSCTTPLHAGGAPLYSTSTETSKARQLYLLLLSSGTKGWQGSQG